MTMPPNNSTPSGNKVAWQTEKQTAKDMLKNTAEQTSKQATESPTKAADKGTSHSTKSASKNSPKIPPVGERALAWVYAHPVASALGCFLLVLATSLAIFYFTVFSDIGSSADFIYSNF